MTCPGNENSNSTKKINIVSMNASHLEEVLKIENSSFEKGWSRAAFENELNNPLTHYWAAEVDGGIAGYAGMWRVFDEGSITNIAVHPNMRRRGIADKLMCALLNEAENSGVKMLLLEVRKSNIAAQNLYKKFGFEAYGERKGYYEGKEDALLMRASCVFSQRALRAFLVNAHFVRF